jgi:hypothetical protein
MWGVSAKNIRKFLTQYPDNFYLVGKNNGESLFQKTFAYVISGSLESF